MSASNVSRLVLLLGVMSLLAIPGCQMPRSAEVDDYLKGQLAADKGQLDDALANLTHAIEKNPKMGLAYMSRGEVLKARGDYEKAAGDFAQVTKLEPFNFDAHYELGLMYQYLKKFEAAITAYQKAVEIRPLDPHANMNLALVYTQMDQPLRGLGYAQRAVNGDEQSPLTHANLGILYSQIGYSELAIDELQKAIELNSQETQVFLALIGEYVKLKKYVPARNVADAGCKISPTAALYERLGSCLYFLGSYEEGRTAFENALKLDPTYFMALNGLGATAMRQALQSTPADLNLARQAVAYWQRSLKQNPNQPNIKGLLEKYTGKLGLDKPEQP